ncbi:MAG: transcription elongation factor GreA [Myxococcota bacterium]
MAERVPMTPRGYEDMKANLHKLKTQDRPHNVREIETAIAHGDLSENAEYHAAKERQSHIVGQIASLEDKLARAQVIDPPDRPPDNVQFGVTVLLSDSDSGEEITYTIVGDDEANPNQGRISLSSPVARALINKKVDETVIVRAPKGDRKLEILEIKFDPAVPDSTS